MIAQEKLKIEVTEVPYKELEDAKKDTDRLEWMFRNEVRMIKYFDGHDVSSADGKTLPFKSPREAIDAAMKGAT